ncbi:ABC transporter substrate-binding protein [Pseudoalteromonas rubra]|uniref:ABC transporter substrate-binding protein n=1 Tax=Pseudoalteromonas rubra TaxID=43658 RepID=A0A5S3WGR2_9GAMM|nr:transporter substrate-binding domain-containing protein [Pseudoalteromonas rubra]TMP26107.1 ABC transporter substrate-binding protein [Pseudoalteromonas rubra]TMP29758.1 ABC transporter substrate-binding protein [Pseudoalteromonas rubra]
MARLDLRAVLVLIITLFSLSGTELAQAENTQSDVVSAPISVCFERWRPFSFIDQDGIARGQEVDLIKAAAQALNRAVEFSELPFKRCVANVKFGSTDFSLHVDKTDGLAIFSDAATFWQLSLAVSAARFKTLDEFKTISTPRIVLATEYPYPKAVYRKLEALDARLVRRSYYEENDEHAKTFFDILTTKRVDAMLVDKQWAQHMIEKFNLPVNILAQDFHREPQFIGYRHSNAPLAQQLEAALSALPEDVRTTIKNQYKY